MLPRFSSLAVASLLAFPLFTPSCPAWGAPPPQAEVVASLASPVMQRDGQGIVTLTCATPGAVIRYSIDGTDPSPKTGPYLGPIGLAAGGVVKARAFSDDRQQMSELA